MKQDNEASTQDSLPAAPPARILSPVEMTGYEWWLEEWFSEWKSLASIKNDTSFLAKTKSRSGG